MTTLRVINNENYENVLKIGEVLISEESVNDGSMTFYYIKKDGVSSHYYSIQGAWLMETHFEVIN